MCIFSLLLFLDSVLILALLIRQKRFRWLWLWGPASFASYLLEQCFDASISGKVFSDAAAKIIEGYVTLSDTLLLGICFVFALSETMMLLNIRRFENNTITLSSIKEAMDTLPSGILCYAEGNQLLLVNRAMESVCRRLFDTELEDPDQFITLLHEGELKGGGRREFTDGMLILIAGDGSAWKISEDTTEIENSSVKMLLISEITEAYRKMLQLKEMKSNVDRLGKKLNMVNREIVPLTVEREALNAKVKIHDELGNLLLSIRHFLINGGGGINKTELVSAIRSNVCFLRNEALSSEMDEYEILFSMAEQLGITISISGELPQTEENKAVTAAAIHECFTNTIRHAHGNSLRLEITEDGAMISERLTNNGIPPKGEIDEKGGLGTLRQLVEQAGGCMTVEISPTFAITIKLPKEDEYGLQSIDCG